MQIYNAKLDYGSTTQNANGGSELMARKFASLDKKLLKEFQIVVSRVENPLDQTKLRILHLNDLPGDPASDHLKNGGWEKFHKIVAVSNWQMQNYINHYGIPWSRIITLQNAIDPIEIDMEDKWRVRGTPKPGPDPIKFIYTPTPHRGLELLVPVFKKLCETHDNLQLDVYSSFELYGWPQRDEQYEPLYEACRQDPKINYHGAVSNEVVREALKQAHIFAYPSIWPETSCLSLMEAMSAGCICVHSNYGALPETASNWTSMYHFTEDKNDHCRVFYTVLCNTLEDIKTKSQELTHRLLTQKSYCDIFYSWNPNRRVQWEALMGLLLANVKDRAFEQPQFVYRTG